MVKTKVVINHDKLYSYAPNCRGVDCIFSKILPPFLIRILPIYDFYGKKCFVTAFFRELPKIFYPFRENTILEFPTPSLPCLTTPLQLGT